MNPDVRTLRGSTTHQLVVHMPRYLSVCCPSLLLSTFRTYWSSSYGDAIALLPQF